MTEQEWLSNNPDFGVSIWNKKYRYKDENFEDFLHRISGNNQNIEKYIREKKFLFGGRILANRGLEKLGKKVTLSNCYVITPPEDSIESIYECASKLARTYSYGGGCGIDITKLAPKGAKVNNTAESTSGSVSFMDLYSLTTHLIGQNGRRGALMISLDCDHPDIEDFINIKKDLTRVLDANTSIRFSDDFMNAVIEDKDFTLSFERPETGEKIEKTVRPREIFKMLADNNWEMGEPGCLFWDRISNYNLMSNTKDFSYAGTNPCVTGDTIINTADGEFPIRELVGKTPYIYCMDDDGIITIRQATKIWKTRENADLVEVRTGKGNLRCTPDHRIYTKNRGWVEAKDLKRGDKVVGLNRTMKDEKHLAVGANWNVIEVITLDEKEDVYDMTVPEVHNFVANRIVIHNCAEEPLPAGGSCLLGSINLSAFVRHPCEKNAYFDTNDFADCVEQAVIALNEVLDEGLPLHPLKEQRDSVEDWRQIGLGIMGLGDMLIELGIEFGTNKAISICDQIGKAMGYSAIMASARLAKEYGAFRKCNIDDIISTQFFKNHITSQEDIDYCKQYGLRNSQLLTIAPTGTLSTMLDISGGIEPLFATHYTRMTKSLYGKDVSKEIYPTVLRTYFDTEGKLPSYCITATELEYEKRLKMQSIWQKHIDASISSTVNVPEDMTKEEIFDLYVKAWQYGLKGVTVFRQNCQRQAILTVDNEKEKKETKAHDLARGDIIAVDSNVIGLKRKLQTGCGTLHVQAYFDPTTGLLLETYFSKGSTGGCEKTLVGLSRMISLASRAGVAIEDIVDQLNSTGVCPSYAVRQATHHDTSIGACCPMAIGRALLDMFNEVQGWIWDDDEKTLSTKIDTQTVKKTTKKCPQCGSEMTHEGGCDICKNCGWSHCD